MMEQDYFFDLFTCFVLAFSRSMNNHPGTDKFITPKNLPLNRPIILGSLAFGILAFLLPVYGKQLGASALEIGGLFSVFAFMVALIRPLVGWAMDQVGRRAFLVGGLIFYTVTMVLFSIANDITTLYIARIIQGVAASLVWVSAYTIATEIVPPGNRGSAIGSVDESAARGALYGAIAGFGLLSFFPLDSAWTILFICYTVLAALGTIHAWKNIPETLSHSIPQVNTKPSISSPLFKLMIIVFITGLSTAMIGPLILIFLQDKFTSDLRMLAAAFIPAAVIYSFLPSHMGKLSDRFGRASFIALGLASAGIVSLILPTLPHLGWLILFWALEAFGMVLAAPAQEALVADLTGTNVRGMGYGLYTSAHTLGATVGPLLGGLVYDSIGHAAPFYLNGIVLIIAAIPVLLVFK